MERHAPSAAYYPDMALEVARVIAACKSLSEGDLIKVEPKITKKRCEEAVNEALNNRTVGTHRQIALETLSSLMLIYVNEVLASEEDADEDRVEELREVVKEVRSGKLLEKLQTVWDETQNTGMVDETVKAYTAQGWGAMDISWAVITFETHKNIKLIWHQANKLERHFPDRTSADLFGWGWIGLRTALRHYDPSRGYTFSTYACTRIAGSIRDGVRSEDPVPKRLATYARKVAKAEDSLTQSMGRKPSLEEVANHIGEETEKLSIMSRLAPAASVDEIVNSASERGSFPSWLIDLADPADSALDSACASAIENALSQLPQEEREAIQLLIMEARTPTEARRVTGATARQMRQRRERGLNALRGALEPWAEAI